MINEYPQIDYPFAESLILPYIVAFIDERQDQLLLWPKELIRDHNDFINTLNRSVNNESILNPFARVFSYQKDYLNIYITYPSNAKEASSGRLGLHLTLGVLFHKNVFSNFIPCKYFMEYYLLKFEKIFNVDLDENGPTEFIEKLKNNNDYPVVCEKIKELLSELLLSLFQINKVKSYNFLDNLYSFFNRKNDKFLFPKVIFCSQNVGVRGTLLLFFSVIDKYLQCRGRLKNLDFSTADGRLDKSVLIVPCLPNNMRLKIDNDLSSLIAITDITGKLIILKTK